MTAEEFLTRLQGEVVDDIFDRRNYTLKFFCLSTENMNLKLKQINVNDHTKVVEIELTPEHP